MDTPLNPKVYASKAPIYGHLIAYRPQPVISFTYWNRHEYVRNPSGYNICLGVYYRDAHEYSYSTLCVPDFRVCGISAGLNVAVCDVCSPCVGGRGTAR